MAIGTTPVNKTLAQRLIDLGKEYGAIAFVGLVAGGYIYLITLNTQYFVDSARKQSEQNLVIGALQERVGNLEKMCVR